MHLPSAILVMTTTVMMTAAHAGAEDEPRAEDDGHDEHDAGHDADPRGHGVELRSSPALLDVARLDDRRGVGGDRGRGGGGHGTRDGFW
jgi:hypothetical protein